MTERPEPPISAPKPDPIPLAVATYIAEHTRTYPGGQIYAVDEWGYARFHSSIEGCPNWSLDDLVEWTRSSRPELWNTPK